MINNNLLMLSLQQDFREPTFPDGDHQIGRVTVSTQSDDLGETSEGHRYRRSIKYKGPRAEVNRLTSWKKFGAAAKEDCPKPRIGEDVFFEFVEPDPKEAEWISNGVYVNYARENDWTDSEIKQIIHSNHPDQVFEKILRQKIQTLFAEIDYKWKLDLMKREEEHKSALEESVDQSDQKQPESKQTPIKLPKEKMGLRARMAAKKQVPESTVKTDDKKSIRDKLRVKKQEHSGDEQKSTLFVTNVPDYYVEQDIRIQIAENINVNIRRINIVRQFNHHNIRESIGKAFVVLSNPEQANICLEYLNTCRWDALVVHAEFAKPKPKK